MIHYSIAPEFDKMDLVVAHTSRGRRAYAVKFDDETFWLTFFLGGTDTMMISYTYFINMDCRVLEMQGAGYKLFINGQGWRVQTLVERAAEFPEQIRLNF